MNANVASTTAPIENAYAPRVMIMTFGRHTSTVNYTDIKKVRAYMKKKATQGFTIDSVFGMGDESVLITLTKGNHVSYTPGFQYARIHDNYIYAYGTMNSCKNWSAQITIPEHEPEPVQYGVRTIVNGVIEDWTRYDTELDARESAQNIVDADPTGNTHATIIPIMPDGTLGGVLDVIRYEPPTENTDWMFPDDDEPEPTPVNAVEECANICPTAQDAVNIASILDTPIRIITPTHAIEVNWTVCRVKIRRNNRYVRGFIELEDVSFDMDKDGLRISYYEKGINHFDDWFIAWGDIQTITALTSKLDIFRSVKGAN